MQTIQQVDFDLQPYLVVWETTRACVLACRHCRAASQPRRHPQELTTEEGQRFIDQVVRAKPGIFIITGGDPTQRPDFRELVGYAAKQGLRVAFSPSATPKLLGVNLKELKDLGVARMSISVDGACRETHNAFRGVAGSWDWTMQALKNAREADLPIQINTTFTRHNIGELDKFKPLLEELKPSTWSVFLLVPTGRGKVADLLSGQEIEDLFERLYALSRSVPFPIKTTEGQHYRRVVLQHMAAEGAQRPAETMGVNDGKGFVFVSHVGDICPSGFLPYVAGNVRTDELIEVYRHSPIFVELRNSSLLKGKCGRCEYKEICGGSRARAYAMTGDHLAEEPFCVYQPQNGKA
ncbi:MAG: radical SAM protein [Planctomycetota bacterium]|nr:radical SAM protein [Planctomycetota bacterium]